MKKYYIDIVIVAFLMFTAILYSFTLVDRKVFFLGDSISMMYGEYLPQHLNDNLIYGRKGDDLNNFGAPDFKSKANGEDSETVRAYLDSLLSFTDFDTDILVINCGLHDIKVDPQNEKPLVEASAYEQNLEYILTTLINRQITPIFVTTTPVNDSIHNRAGVHFERYNADVITYNKIALQICKKNEVSVIDLNAFTRQIQGKENIYSDHVHFVDDVRKKQAEYIAKYLNCN